MSITGRYITMRGGNIIGAPPSIVPPSLLLDLYPATAAYSLRKLRTGVTNVVRVRRTGDNAELDFTAEEVANGTLTAWVVAGGGPQNGGITTIYNQGTGGSTYNATQPSVAFQYVIVLSGILQTMNSLPAIDSLSLPPYNVTRLDGIKTILGVNRLKGLNTINYLMYNDSGIGQAGGIFQGGTFSGINGLGGFDGVNVRSITGENLLRKLGYWNMRSGNLYVSENSSAETNSGSFASSLSMDKLLGRALNSTLYSRAIFQEMIFYTTDESANKAAIETNINDYYGIY